MLIQIGNSVTLEFLKLLCLDVYPEDFDNAPISFYDFYLPNKSKNENHPNIVNFSYYKAFFS